VGPAASKKNGERGGRLKQQRHRLRCAAVASGMKRPPTGDDQCVEASRLHHRILVSLMKVRAGVTARVGVGVGVGVDARRVLGWRWR
jgi:hypothetical protein